MKPKPTAIEKEKKYTHPLHPDWTSDDGIYWNTEDSVLKALIEKELLSKLFYENGEWILRYFSPQRQLSGLLNKSWLEESVYQIAEKWGEMKVEEYQKLETMTYLGFKTPLKQKNK